MRRFRFTLETVLKVKRSREEKVQRDFAQVLEKRALALANLGQLEGALKDMNAWQSGRISQGGALNRFEVSQFEASRKACIERIGWQRDYVAQIEEALEAKRLELVEASRETKVIEKLEESQHDAYLEKLNREEQTFMDELASHNSAA